MVGPGIWQHVVQRGNEARQIFFADADRLLYLDLVAKFAERFQTEIVGFRAMTNHAHLDCDPPPARVPQPHFRQRTRRLRPLAIVYGR
ncbi:MAG: transposase [Bryobacteraceae bacterium]|nr:transposase [Bryobacteraceae bacterium]